MGGGWGWGGLAVRYAGIVVELFFPQALTKANELRDCEPHARQSESDASVGYPEEDYTYMDPLSRLMNVKKKIRS